MANAKTNGCKPSHTGTKQCPSERSANKRAPNKSKKAPVSRAGYKVVERQIQAAMKDERRQIKAMGERNYYKALEERLEKFEMGEKGDYRGKQSWALITAMSDGGVKSV